MTVSHFDERAREWDSDPEKVERARVTADAIRHTIPLHPDMSALEYGCGTGLLSFALQSDLGQITLADTSKGMLEVCRMKGLQFGSFRPDPDPAPGPLLPGAYSLAPRGQLSLNFMTIKSFRHLHGCLHNQDVWSGNFLPVICVNLN